MRVPRRKRRGGAVVEMAAVLPIFIVFLFGQIESSRLGMVAQLLTTAAREACRVAVIEGSTATQVEDRVETMLAGSGIIAPVIEIGPQDWESAAFGTPISVTVSVRFDDVAWLPSPRFLKDVVVRGQATLNRE